ncbi:MAG: N-acetylmuramoyl-L-alanine amidase [Acetivibrio sp.]
MKTMLSIFLLLFLTIFPNVTADAAALKIRYGSKNYNYSGAQAGATLEGKKINLNGTPGILLNDTCMLPLKDVFESALDVEWYYDDETKELIISQNDILIQMKLNSKTAYVNEKKQTLDVAPKKIKFYSNGKTKIYVPARFVAESLGYSYTWNSTTKASDMKNPFVIKYEKDWTVYKGIQGKVNFDGIDIKLASMPSILLDNTTLLDASAVFKSGIGTEYSYDKTTKQLTIAQNDVTIVMTMDSRDALVNEVPTTMGTAARIVYNKANEKSYIMVPGEFVATNLGYHYSWNAGTKTTFITTGTKVYVSQIFSPSTDGQTSLSSLEASCTDKTDILTLIGTQELEINVKELNASKIQLVLSNVFTGIDNLSKTFQDSYYLKGIRIKTKKDAILITMDKDPTCNYYTLKTGEKFQLVFSESASVGIEESAFQMKMTLPKGISADSITTEDLYYLNRFVLTIPGDYVTYFNENPILYNTLVVENVVPELNADGNTDIIVYTHKLQGYKIVDCGAFIGVDIGTPHSIYSKIIVLDAGHGGRDNGTSKSGTLEKNLNYTIIYKLAKEFFNSPDSDIKAYWTRYDDIYIGLDERAEFANKIGADLFVSLHMNSAGSKSANGLEVFHSTDNKASLGALNSKNMATLFYTQLIEDLGMSKRGVKSAGFAVIKKNTVPAILIELGFLSNSSDYKKLTDPDFQYLAAQSIYNAAVTLFDTYPTGR